MIETYQPLYLKYRPQSLGDLVGQSSVAQTLSNAIANNRISHAYLFTGPRGCGKTSSARILAKSLNCQQGPTAEPCQICTSCTEIKSGVSPSVIEIDAASNNSVDDARMLIERAPLVAQGGRFKLYIIDECHMLTKEAFNALLKTIEEPPEKVIFILATTEEHKVPPTIISRCQRLMFRLINQADLGAHLKNIAQKENILIDEDAVGLVARRSGGGLRDALGLLDQASLLATPPASVSVTDLLTLLGAVHEDLLLEISQGVLERNGHAVLTAIHSLMAEGREPAVLTLELAKHFLSLAKASYVSGSGTLTENGLQSLVLGSQNYLKGLVAQAPRYETGELAQIVEYLDKLEQTIRRSSQPALNLEMGLLSLCHRHDIRLVRELDERLRVVENEVAENPLVRPSGAPASTRASHPPAPTHAATAAPAPAQTHAPAPTYASEANSAPKPSPAPFFQGSRPAASVNVSETANQEGGAAPPRTSAPAASTPAERAPANVEPPRQVPAPPPVQGQAAPTTAPGDLVALEELWSNLMEELHQRSIPAYSIVHAHGFPISYDQKELIVGVKENFQASLQGRVEHIQRAALAVVGREVAVKIKPMTQGAPRAASQPRAKAPKTASPLLPPEPEEPEGAPSPARTGPSESSATSSSTSGAASSGSEFASPVRTTSLLVAAPVERHRLDEPEDDGDSTLFTEAYRLFEGPGSRIVG